MLKLIISSILFLLISCSDPKPKTLAPDMVSPDVYKVLLENEDVKVLEAVFAPGQSDNMHDHNPMTAYVLEGGKAQITLPDGTVNEREIPSGASVYANKGQRHKVKNIGENPMKIILVESN